jgi:hypothetical protein
MSTDVHIVTHTHWDREWYHPAERFRQRLVALIDELIDDPPGRNESFLLDGQVIVVEDYVSVRPDRAEALYTLMREGRIEAGPWYVLADELIPSGEAIVRNLLTGRRILRRIHVDAPPVLYCPDSFGHPAALPEIAAGFGLPLVVLWRGYGSERWPRGDAARWRGPDGVEVLLYHLPRAGYEFGSHLPTHATESDDRWRAMRDELLPRGVIGVHLVPNGADHHARQSELPAALDAVEHAGRGDGVHRSSLRAFAEAFVARAAHRQLPVVTGELRDSYGYTWALQGTFATRAHEKRLNAHAERALVRDTEPFAALASRRARSRRPLVDAAWRSLLQAHPHDTLCGCSVDAVATAMEQRIAAAVTQAAGVRDDALWDLIGHDPARARTARSSWMPIVMIRNAAPRVRSGVAIVDVEEFIADVAVGPGSAPAGRIDTTVRRTTPHIAGISRAQVLARDVAHSRTESPRHYPDDDLVSRTRVACWVDDVPPYGIASHAIGGATRRTRTAPVAPVTAKRNGGMFELSNGVLRAVVDQRTGDVVLESDAGARRIPSLLRVVDEEDVGDSYTPAPRPRAHRVECRGARIVHRGPWRGELLLRFDVRTPTRTMRAADVEIDVHLVLDAAAPFLRIDLRGENRARDHRLRLHVATDVRAVETWADAAFGPVRREPIAVTPAEAAIELPPPTAPLHRYVSVFDDRAGFTLFSDGLAEYETLDDGALAVTLLRAIGELSKNELPERPGHAGWPSAIPAAQCLGPFAASFAVLPHGPRTAATIDTIERTADDVLLPLTGDSLRSALAVPAPVVGIELIGTALGFSACTESEDGEWLVLRCTNLSDAEAAGAWRLPWRPHEARRARLDETIIGRLETHGAEVPFRAGPREVVTILVRRH